MTGRPRCFETSAAKPCKEVETLGLFDFAIHAKRISTGFSTELLKSLLGDIEVEGVSSLCSFFSCSLFDFRAGAGVGLGDFPSDQGGAQSQYLSALCA